MRLLIPWRFSGSWFYANWLRISERRRDSASLSIHVSLPPGRRQLNRITEIASLEYRERPCVALLKRESLYSRSLASLFRLQPFWVCRNISTSPRLEDARILTCDQQIYFVKFSIPLRSTTQISSKRFSSSFCAQTSWTLDIERSGKYVSVMLVGSTHAQRFSSFSAHLCLVVSLCRTIRNYPRSQTLQVWKYAAIDSRRSSSSSSQVSISGYSFTKSFIVGFRGG